MWYKDLQGSYMSSTIACNMQHKGACIDHDVVLV